MLKLLMQQVALFVVCLLELLDIHFERSKWLSNRKIQCQGAMYLEKSSKDAVAQLFQSVPQRSGIAHCWLAILVVMWIAALSVTVAYEWTRATAAVIRSMGNAYAIELSRVITTLFQLLSQSFAYHWKGLIQSWQANSPSFRLLARLPKPSLTFD